MLQHDSAAWHQQVAHLSSTPSGATMLEMPKLAASPLSHAATSACPMAPTLRPWPPQRRLDGETRGEDAKGVLVMHVKGGGG